MMSGITIFIRRQQRNITLGYTIYAYICIFEPEQFRPEKHKRKYYFVKFNLICVWLFDLRTYTHVRSTVPRVLKLCVKSRLPLS